MMLRCPVKYEHPESVFSGVHARSRAVRLKFPPRVVITSKERTRHRLKATPAAELAHQVCDLRSSEHIVSCPHLVKPAEHSGSLVQILPKSLKQRHLMEEVWGVGNLTPLLSCCRFLRLCPSRQHQAGRQKKHASNSQGSSRRYKLTLASFISLGDCSAVQLRPCGQP